MGDKNHSVTKVVRMSENVQIVGDENSDLDGTVNFVETNNYEYKDASTNNEKMNGEFQESFDCDEDLAKVCEEGSKRSYSELVAFADSFEPMLDAAMERVSELWKQFSEINMMAGESYNLELIALCTTSIQRNDESDEDVEDL